MLMPRKWGKRQNLHSVNTEKIRNKNAAVIYLGKITNHVASTLITFTQNIEQKQVNIIIKGLVIKKQFRQITKILPINLVLFAVNLFPKHLVKESLYKLKT
jgi:methyl coenzyme M reductase subunit C